MKKHIILILAAAMIGTVSCNLLNVENKNSIYGDGYWSAKGDVESYVTGIYTQFRNLCNRTLFLEDRGDSFVAGSEGGPSNPWAQVLTSQTGYSWASHYQVIQNCNMVLKHAPQVHFSINSERDNLLAQAYAIRAYCYFYLLRVWGDVPLETEPTESAKKEKLGRAPATEVLALAISDAERAVELFSADWVVGKGKASKMGTYALLADMYLWKAKVMGGTDEDLRTVIRYADLASAKTSLESNFTDIFSTKNGKEIIWSIYFKYPEKVGHYSYSLKPKTVTVEKAKNADQIPSSTAATHTYSPSPEIIAMLNRYRGDVRAPASYVVGYSVDGGVISTYDNKMNGTKTEKNRVYDNDIILYRHAEMLLFKAEAYAALGEIDQAVAALDQVRSRAGIGAYGGARDKTMVEREILEERAREFYLELKRWPDLIRFHSEGVIDIYQVVPNLKKKADAGVRMPLYFDIPLADIALNPQLEHTAGYENL